MVHRKHDITWKTVLFRSVFYYRLTVAVCGSTISVWDDWGGDHWFSSIGQSYRPPACLTLVLLQWSKLHGWGNTTIISHSISVFQTLLPHASNFADAGFVEEWHWQGFNNALGFPEWKTAQLIVYMYNAVSSPLLDIVVLPVWTDNIC